MKRLILASLAAILGTAVIAAPAYANTPPPVDNPVTGSVTVPSTLTMALSGSSFALTINPGATGNTGIGPSILTATVSTNDSNGYTITDAITTPFATTASVALGGAIQPLVTAGASSNTPTWGTAFSGTTAETTGSKGAPSGATGDVWQQGWQFNPPANQAGGVYNGTIAITAIGS